jgi:putative flippase GtrA
MPRRATATDTGAGATGATGLWATLGRHQIGAFAATAVDFGVMIALVECFHASPVVGTAVGATVGALTNFLLGRAWIFPGHAGHWSGQALRYAMVSAASAGLNALGEHLVCDVARLQYVLARVLVSVAVSLLWNFPMQRRFVFREGKAR